MIDAFGVRKDWWEEPAKERHEFSTGTKVAAGTAAGLGVGAGAAYLATRGKAGKTIIETITRTKKVKVKGKAPAPEPPKPTGVVVKKPEPPAPEPPKPSLYVPPERVARQHQLDQEKIVNHNREQLRLKAIANEDVDPVLAAHAKGDKNLEGIPLSATAKEVDNALPDTQRAARARRRANAQKHGKQGKNPRVKKNDAQIIAKRMLMDMEDEIFKRTLAGRDMSPEAHAVRMKELNEEYEDRVVNVPKTAGKPKISLPAHQKQAKDQEMWLKKLEGKSKDPAEFKRLKAAAERQAKDEHSIGKADLTGQEGDKRNTKYTLSTGAGWVAGSAIGSRVGARAGGTTYKKNRQKVHEDTVDYTTKRRATLKRKREKAPASRVDVPQAADNLMHGKKHQKNVKITDKHGKAIPDPKTWQPSIKELRAIESGVKGTRAMHAGGVAGALTGIALGAGGMYAYRHPKVAQEAVTKADHGVDWKSGALLGAAAGGAAGNIVGVPAAGMAAAMSGKKSSSKAFTRSLIRFNKSPIVLAPVALGAGLGALGGKGAADMRKKERVKKSETPAMQALLDARKAEDPVAKAFFKPKAAALALKPKTVQAPKIKTWSAADDMAKDKAVVTQKARYAMRQTA
jgi:hypothetical protein